MEDEDAIVGAIVAGTTTAVFVFSNAIMAAATAFTEFMNSFQVLGYLGAFLVSMFGNFTIIFPVPYALFVFTMGAIGFNPILIGLASGLGSTIGEFSSYALGRGLSATQLRDKYGERLDRMHKLVEDRGFLTVFLFAATPLPDDMIMIPLGMVKYPFRKAVIASFLGKVVLCTGLSMAGFYGANWLLGLLGGAENPFSIAISAAVIILFSYMTVRIDWMETLDEINKHPFYKQSMNLIMTPINTIKVKSKEFPMPSAIMFAFLIISLTLFTQIWYLFLLAIGVSTVVIIYGIFLELQKEY